MSLEENTDAILTSMYNAATKFNLSLVILNVLVEILMHTIRTISKNAMSKGAIANSAPPK